MAGPNRSAVILPQPGGGDKRFFGVPEAEPEWSGGRRDKSAGRHETQRFVRDRRKIRPKCRRRPPRVRFRMTEK